MIFVEVMAHAVVWSPGDRSDQQKAGAPGPPKHVYFNIHELDCCVKECLLIEYNMNVWAVDIDGSCSHSRDKLGKCLYPSSGARLFR